MGVEPPKTKDTISIGDQEYRLTSGQQRQLDAGVRNSVAAGLAALRGDGRFAALAPDIQKDAVRELQQRLVGIEQDRVRLALAPNFYTETGKGRDAFDWSDSVKQSIGDVVNDVPFDAKTGFLRKGRSAAVPISELTRRQAQSQY